MSKLKVPVILRKQIATFIERNRTYGDNWEAIGALAILFPKGVTLRTSDDFIAWHLFEWAFGKLTRFARTGMKHRDSLHDAAVYLTMLEAFMEHVDGRKGVSRGKLPLTSKGKARRKAVERSARRSHHRRRKPD